MSSNVTVVFDKVDYARAEDALQRAETRLSVAKEK